MSSASSSLEHGLGCYEDFSRIIAKRKKTSAVVQMNESNVVFDKAAKNSQRMFNPTATLDVH
jgi:hypothetical protein